VLAKKQQGDFEGCKCLSVQPISFVESYLYKNNLEDVDEVLQELALPLRQLAMTASGKERWWVLEMMNLCRPHHALT